MKYDKSIFKTKEELRGVIKGLREEGLSYADIGKRLNMHRCWVWEAYNDNRGVEGRSFVRNKIRIRDKNICKICGKKWKNDERKFDVHHVYQIGLINRKYESYESLKDKVVTLCHKCHINLHKQLEEIINNYLKSDRVIFKNDKYVVEDLM